MRVLYSFPHKIGADRICATAWHQVAGVAAAGAEVTLFAASICKPLPQSVSVHTTLAWKGIRIPYRLLGSHRAFRLHDWLVARRLRQSANKFDIVHVWPLGARQTTRVATSLGIQVVLERPNAHTRFAYDVVEKECNRLGIALPPNHEHAYNASILKIEEEEYRLADRLLCPSDFVAQTFSEQGFSSDKLMRHQYGFDNNIFFSDHHLHGNERKLTVLFVGGCAPRKGLHFALEAWLRSEASKDGVFLIAGRFVPGYAEYLERELAHPSIQFLGHRTDIADLMRRSDILVLPSIEEGSALVTSEARGSGCVLLVSEAAGAICRHGQNALVHAVGDVATLAGHFNMLYSDRELLESLRSASLETVPEITWSAAGQRLLTVYREACKKQKHGQ